VTEGEYTATPYVLPNVITSAPTGISWSIIPFPKATSAQQTAEQMNMCIRATGVVNAYCNQTLRSTIDTEVVNGPDLRMNVMNNGTGNTRIILSQWPVTNVLQVAVSPNIFPRQWQTVPTNMFGVERPPVGIYGTSAPSSAGNGGQSILLGAGYVNWANGRYGYTTSATYTSGWPHTSLTAPALAGATTVSVDDVTAFTGAFSYIFDGSQTESVMVTGVTANTPFTLPYGGTTPAGPGTLTLASPLDFDHDAGVMFSSLPQDIIWATILATTIQALEAGITSVSIQNLPGSQTTGGMGILALEQEYQRILNPYRRVF
jgi:hypothetical protein